jgi:tetratricopeptide (TPR) repeat protein
VGQALGNLGNCYYRMGQFARALELYAEAKAIAEELGDRAGVAKACNNLGNCYYRTGHFARAIELHAEHKAMAEELGDRMGVAKACGNIAECHKSTGQYARALELYAEAKAIKEELGGHAGAKACNYLADFCESTGHHEDAPELHSEDKAMAEENQDWAGVSEASEIPRLAHASDAFGCWTACPCKSSSSDAPGQGQVEDMAAALAGPKKKEHAGHMRAMQRSCHKDRAQIFAAGLGEG